MNNEQFDRILHSKLADHKVVPPPEVWAGIEKKTTNRKGYFWWMAGLLIFTIASGLLLLLPESKTKNDLQISLTKNEAIKAKSEIPDPEASKPFSENLTALSSLAKVKQPDKVTSVKHDRQHPNLAQSFVPIVFSDPTSLGSAEEIEEQFPVSILWMDQLQSDSPALSIASMPTEQSVAASVSGNLSLVITAGPAFATKHLNSKFNFPGDEKYIRYRNEAELRNTSWSASMLLQVDLSKFFFIRTGVNYTSVSEKIGMRYIKAQIDGITTDTIVGTRNEITDPTQLLSVSEEENFKLLADYTLRDKAEYRFLSLPLMAGVTFNETKFSFYASAGLALNFSSSYSGKILAPDSAYLFSIRDVSTSPFNKVTGFTFMTAAGIGYSLTDKVKLLIEPSYFRQLPDITKTEYRLSQRFSGYGIQAGVIYKL